MDTAKRTSHTRRKNKRQQAQEAAGVGHEIEMHLRTDESPQPDAALVMPAGLGEEERGN
jgi:hypothetical protein